MADDFFNFSMYLIESIKSKYDNIYYSIKLLIL